jgi:hypothetical protein
MNRPRQTIALEWLRGRGTFEYWRDVTAVNAAHDVLLENGIDNFIMAQEITGRVLAVADEKVAPELPSK